MTEETMPQPSKAFALTRSEFRHILKMRSLPLETKRRMELSVNCAYVASVSPGRGQRFLQCESRRHDSDERLLHFKQIHRQ